MAHNPKGHIQLRNHPDRVRILADHTLIADSRRALELHENGYPVRLYIPRADVNMDCLTPSETVTHCPFKGDTTYYHVEADGNRLEDAGWSYEEPYTAMRDIAGHLAFDHEALREETGE